MLTRNPLPVAAIAAAALALAAVPGASHAATRTSSLGTTAPKLVTVSTVAAGATGDGPATQEECDSRATTINDLRAMAAAAAQQGDAKNAALFNDLAVDEDDYAQDRGCFIVY